MSTDHAERLLIGTAIVGVVFGVGALLVGMVMAIIHFGAWVVAIPVIVLGLGYGVGTLLDPDR